MSNPLSSPGAGGDKGKSYRVLEIIPGFLVWTTFVLSIGLSFVKPLWVIYFIIVFDLYWFVRISYFVFWMFVGWYRYRQESQVDWFGQVQAIEARPCSISISSKKGSSRRRLRRMR